MITSNINNWLALPSCNMITNTLLQSSLSRNSWDDWNILPRNYRYEIFSSQRRSVFTQRNNHFKRDRKAKLIFSYFVEIYWGMLSSSIWSSYRLDWKVLVYDQWWDEFVKLYRPFVVQQQFWKKFWVTIIFQLQILRIQILYIINLCHIVLLLFPIYDE